MAGSLSCVVRLWVIVSSLLIVQFSHASDFGNAASAGVKVIVDSDSQSDSNLKNDLLVMRAPNNDGTSYNRISLFSLTRPLKIINTFDSYGNPAGQPAKLIIIHADRVSINSSIELVGQTADILLISDSGTYSEVSCYSCSFKNFGRVTLAHATPTLSASYLPGELKLLSSSKVNINNLTTVGVASFEAIAKNVAVNGVINTQLRGVYTSDGTYQINSSGGLIIGAGGINLFAGFNIDYATLTLKQPVTSATLSIPASSKITTQALHIATSAPVVISGSINTKSDATSAVSYRGSVSAIPEAIEIYALHENAEITINGELSTDERIDIQGAAKVNLNNNIKAKNLGVISGSKLTHRGTSEFSKATISAESFENNGKLIGRESIKIATEQELQNRFGGKLLAGVIELSSKFSVVRNGSQYPFKAKDDVALVLRPDAPNNIGLGTIDGIAFTGATKVSDLSAAIIGKSITIVASNNVENINPYFEYTPDSSKWVNGIPFKVESASQVQLVAEDVLKIGSGTFVLNSSAIMGVNNPYGEFTISAPYITNERYNTQAVVQPFTEQSTNNNVTSTTTGTEAALMVFSPPGVIYSFSPLGFYFTIKSGGFVNNTAYFEVFNHATFTSSRTASEVESAKVTSIGLSLEQQLNGTTVVKTQTVAECQAKAPKDEASQRACSYNPSVTNYKNLTGTTEESMKGTLFSVKGNISGAAADFYGTNHHLIEELGNQQISAYIAANSGATGTFDRTQKSTNILNGTLTTTYAYTQTATLSADGKNIYVVQTGKLTSTSGTNSGSEADDRFLKTQEASKTIATVSVVDFLKTKFAELKAALIATYNAFIAWFA